MCTGVLSFMLEATPTTGAIETSDEEKRSLAAASVAWTAKQPKLSALFPTLPQLAAAAAAPAAAPAAGLAASLASLSVLSVDGDTTSASPPAAWVVPWPHQPAHAPPPPPVARAMDAAAACLRGGDPEAAASTLRAALGAAAPSSHPPTPEDGSSQLLSAALADALLTCGDFEGAAAASSRAGSHAAAASAAVHTAARARADGNARFAARDWAGACAAYRGGLEHAPRCAPLWANVAAAAAADDDWGSTEEAARRAVGLQASHAKARRRLAEALLKRGDAGGEAAVEAAKHFTVLVAAFPADAGLRAGAAAAEAALERLHAA